ncbi:MAG: hypothetical protein IKQ17_10200 [Kiritimatiellae bacterium]|nr:hypothetical protein [Kiritimatiellia bacterium]
MAKREQKKLAKGIYLCDGSIFFRQMVDGERKMRKAVLQGAQALDARGRPTKELKREYQNWALARQNDAHEAELRKGRVPTCRELKKLYEKAAYAEQAKNGGTPHDRTISNTMKHWGYAVEGCRVGWDRPYTDVTTDRLEEWFVRMVEEGKERVSAWTYVSGVKSITARWTLRYYEKEGWGVKAIETPTIKNVKPGRYERLTDEARAGVKKWYEGLWELADKRMWLAATMMLQFAMRNGDVVAATGENFVERKGVMHLRYKPRKTESSSGRVVMWPIHEDIWKRIAEARKTISGADKDGLLVPGASWVFARLNRALRDAVPELAQKEKAMYELRKLRVDAEYRNFGAERASALSGDDIRTLSYFYADVADLAPAAVKAEDLI